MPEIQSETRPLPAGADKGLRHVDSSRESSASRTGLPAPLVRRRSIRREAALVTFGALLGCVFALGPNVTARSSSPASTGSAHLSAGITLGLEFAKAHAESRRQRRTRLRQEARRKEAEKRQEEADKKLLGNKIASLPASCAYDSYASFSSPTDIHVCDAFYFQPYEEDGVTGYQGFPIGADPEEIKRAKARRDKTRKKRLAEAEKKLKAARKASLSTDCNYDSFASFAVTSHVYTCSGIQFIQVKENGVMVYDRRGVISAKTKQELARRALAQAKHRAKVEKAQQPKRLAELPKGCTYDSYASFFTSSNVYTCAGVRYRQYREAGASGFEEINL